MLRNLSRRSRSLIATFVGRTAQPRRRRSARSLSRRPIGAEPLESRAMLATTATLSGDLSGFTQIPVTFLRPDGSVGFSRTAYVGQLGWSAMTGDAAAAGVPAAFKSFCIDGLQSVAPGTNSFAEVRPLAASSLLGATRAGLLTDFWRQYGPADAAGFADKTDSAAFQLAVWEIINDGLPVGTRLASDLATGQFSVAAAGRTMPAALRAAQWLAGFDTTAPGKTAVTLHALESPTRQDQVVCVPTIDLDVDSDNADTIPDPASDPVDRSSAEEAIEDEPALPGVIVPVGGDRAKMIVHVPQGRTATLAITQGADKVRLWTAQTGGTAIPAAGTTIVGGGSPQTFWIEAFAPSASMADIAFTLTASGTGTASSDKILTTAAGMNMVAHRTGGRLGEVVSEDLESAGDPNSYMILTNRDFEQGLPLAGRDFDDEIALLPPLLGPEGQFDDDLAKLTLKKLPSDLNAGSVRLKVSHPAAVRLFKADAATGLGVRLLAGEWSASLGGSGYLAQLKSRDVDIWLEGLSMVKDFVFTVEYVAPSGSVLSSDDVHMLIADWTFRGSDGYEVPFVSPVWLDALLAATDSPKKPLADPTGAFYKIHIDGLAPQLVTQLRVASDSTADFYTESYAGGDFDTAYSTATVSRRFGVLHSAAHVLYAPEDPVVTPAQRQLIRETLDLNVVHNDGLRATVLTPWDVQSDQLKKHGRFEWSLTEKPEGIYQVGDTILGTVAWPEKMFPVVYDPFLMTPISPVLYVQTYEDAQQSTRPIFAHQARSATFQFKAQEEGYLRLTFSAAAPNGMRQPQILSSILVRITANGKLPKWEAQAWNALKVDDFVPGDPINRNRQITTKYAEMFNTDKKPNELNPFEWFGMAAFASRLAGEGMHTAMRDGWAPLPDKPPFDVVPPSPQKVFAGLAEGNLEIFIDMYKAGLAYKEDKFQTINNSAEFSPEQKNAWEIIERGQTAGKIEVIWEGVDGLVDVEQRVALQRVLDKDPDLWRSATNNLVSASLKYRISMIASPFPGDNSTFQDYRVKPDGNNPRIPANATFDQVEHRLTWIRSRIPKWRGGWRATYDYIEIPKLLNGDYNN